MTPERDFKGVWIPREVYLNTELSWTEKILLVEIDSLDNDDLKGCFASNAYLGEFLGKSEGTIANIISSLIKKGYLYQVFFDGRNRGLRVVRCGENNSKASLNNESSLHENVKADFTKTLKLTSQKREHNNTDNNTDNNNKEKADFLNLKEIKAIQSKASIIIRTRVDELDIPAPEMIDQFMRWVTEGNVRIQPHTIKQVVTTWLDNRLNGKHTKIIEYQDKTDMAEIPDDCVEWYEVVKRVRKMSHLAPADIRALNATMPVFEEYLESGRWFETGDRLKRMKMAWASYWSSINISPMVNVALHEFVDKRVVLRGFTFWCHHKHLSWG